MVSITHNGAIGTLFEGMGIGLSGLRVMQTDQGPMILAVSGPEGG